MGCRFSKSEKQPRPDEGTEGEVGVAASVPWPPPEGMADRDRVEIDARHHAWRSLCKVLIASNEFIYVR